ncbi:MAG: bifunctional acetate--CoA ligase family protein/GNAT family N-acetyltransferase [Pseudomonadota bacterium]
MTIRNLDKLFKPGSIALVGASKRQASVGAVLAKNLFSGGFDGPVMPVNPKHRSIQGVLTHETIESLPLVPDLAVIATPPATVPEIISELGAKGTKAAVVITAGLDEPSAAGRSLRQSMLEAARPHLLRIVGPNCLGTLVPGIGLNASFAHLSPKPGKLAFVAQSGAVVTSVLDWATSRGIGFSHAVALGDMSDVDFGDMLDYLANDSGTSAILLYIEAITDARKFMSAGRAAARMKPVVVVKAGRHPEGARAAASHTGALAGADDVYDTAFRRAGMLRVIHLEELFDAVQTLSMVKPPEGDRIAIVTNGGGVGVMATDALMDHGGNLAKLDPETIALLDQHLPPTWSKTNPVDIIGDAPPERYAHALKAVISDPAVDAVLAINCPTAVTSPKEASEAVISAIGNPKLPILTSWLGDGAALPARQAFIGHKVPTFETPEDAVNAFMQLVAYRRNQTTLMETPPSMPEDFTPDLAAARSLIEGALETGKTWLNEPAAKALMEAYDIPTAKTLTAATPRDAAKLATEFGGGVAIKILSDDILHKSDVGGVALDLFGPGHVEEAATAMLERVRTAMPDAHIDGFSVQPMIRRPGAHELIVGMISDRTFGPMILFGQGGTAVEVMDDKALAMPPLNMRLAYEVMSRTRIHRLLRGYRDRPAAALDAVAATLIKIAQLVSDHPEIDELDINPLLADDFGVIALDVRVKLTPTERKGQERLAIRPYPKDLEETVKAKDGRTFTLRPVRPEDEPAFHLGFTKLTPEEIQLRFFMPMKTLSHVMAARFTQIDYDREMALVLADESAPGMAAIGGVARLAADPDNERAEYAIIVGQELTGKGLGRLMMERLIAYAKERGIGELYGEVLRKNKRMLSLCSKLGFNANSVPDDPSIVKVSLDLGK